MKITKFVHSCSLIEDGDRVGMIDPGNYSWDSGVFDINKLERLDDIIITHDHADHMHIPFIKQLVTKFPNAIVMSNQSVVSSLLSEGIMATTDSNSEVEFFEATHESMAPLLPHLAENVGVHYLDRLTHPGDCHHFSSSKEILALPMTAPWGTIARAANLGAELKQKYIIPIHDWHYRDEAREMFYGRLEEYFSTQGIAFIRPKNGVPINL